MKTPSMRLAARLAIAAVCLGGAAWGIRADQPQTFPGPQMAPGGMIQQPLPYYPSGGPYMDPSAAMANPAMVPGGYNPALYGGPAPCEGPPAAESCDRAGGGCCFGCRCLTGCFCNAMRGGEWRYAAGGIFLQRVSAGSQTLLRDNFDNVLPLTSNEVFNATNMHFDIPGGFTVGVTHLSTHGWDVEAKYTHIDSFQATKTVFGNVFLQTDKNGGTFTVLNPRLEDDSLLHGTELNFRWHLSERLRVLAGFRWFELLDRYRVDSIGAEFLVPVTLRNNTLNELYGFQLGADTTLVNWGFVTLEFGAKLGVYDNAASQNSREVDTTFVDLSLAAAGHHTAFSAELNLGGTVELIMDRLYLRGGYQLLWLDGVLLAPDQIGANDFRHSTAGLRYDTVFYHGAYATVELAF